MKYQDLQISDAELYSQFLEFVRLGNVQSALNILSNNPQLDTKKFVAEVLNDMTEQAYGHEDAYYTEVEDVLAQHLVDMQQTVDDYIFLGVWDAATQYAERNLVKYNHELYYCLQTPPIGTAPAQEGAGSTYWMFLGLRGEDGVDSIAGLNFKGEWDSTTSYETNDVVYTDQTFFYALQPSTNQATDQTEYWGVLFTAMSQIIEVSQYEPDINEGDYWFQIIPEE